MRFQDKRLVLAPTDLSNYLGCRHLPGLDLRVARGEAERPVRYGPVIEELKARGIAHEQAYLAHLKASGHDVADAGTETAEAGLARTLELMRGGADVIYQATLADEAWSGRADFLMRVDEPSDFGDWSYEVTDTKLARDTRAGTILQLCVYTFLLKELQGKRPAFMHVVTPANDFTPHDYRTDDYAAYFRLLEKGIDAYIRAPHETYPELVPHCDYCAWWSQCEKRRRGDDHLCYVAGITGGQIRELRSHDVDTLEKLAQLDEVPDPERGTQEALTRVREQARVQLIGRRQLVPYHELRQPLDAEHGLALLPEPTADDIFLDFEGNHFAEGGVTEYLTGYLAPGAHGEYAYTPLWAITPAEEQRAFEAFMDFAIDTVARNPGAHIYHFAPYEPAALKRLMGHYATREVELDRLLRGEVFVDLYAVVRRGLLASVERYSLKDLEPFFGYAREQDLHEAGMSRRVIETAIDAGDVDESLDRHRRIVEDYNREDCVAARGLRDWLETLRRRAIDDGHVLPRPSSPEAEASEKVGELDQRLHALRDALLEGVPADPAERDEEAHARFLLAHMMEFHRREDKASWWEYFRVLALDTEDYPDERRAIAGLVFAGEVESELARLQRYRFAPQELDARDKDDVFDAEQTRIGQIVAIDLAEGQIDIQKSKATEHVHPSDVVLHNRVPIKTLQESLIRLGEAVLDDGFAPRAPYRAAFELLLRRPLAGGRALQADGEDTLDAACRIGTSLDGQVLAIQGPPGTGKTYTGGHIICALKRAGLKVGVTAVSHKVIENLLEGAKETARKQAIELRAVHRKSGDYGGDWDIERVESYDSILSRLGAGDIDVVGATAWGWARPDFAASVDVLIVDEAGQMSLSNVLATAQAGRSLILLGDPQQLEQPLQCNHPEGSEVSALHHLLDGEDTMPAHKGLFLGETWRLHPAIAEFTSEAYYEGKLRAVAGLEHQAVLGPTRLAGSGLRYVPVAHTGNQARAPEEVDIIAGIVAELAGGGTQWRDKHKRKHDLTTGDILIVAPYNAQVSALKERLPAYRIGTVDRFQGQEAPVVIYSMTSSSPEDAPRGMEFLYSPNRFNVATSRARALCILVGSPKLFAPECKSPRQMKMANSFCRYLELATTIS